MIGRRVYDVKPWNLEAGDYLVAGDGTVWVRLPDGSGPCNLKTWDTTVHDDGTVTLSPSIQRMPTHDFPEEWHGFLRAGVWEVC